MGASSLWRPDSALKLWQGFDFVVGCGKVAGEAAELEGEAGPQGGVFAAFGLVPTGAAARPNGVTESLVNGAVIAILHVCFHFDRAELFLVHRL